MGDNDVEAALCRHCHFPIRRSLAMASRNQWVGGPSGGWCDILRPGSGGARHEPLVLKTREDAERWLAR